MKQHLENFFQTLEHQSLAQNVQIPPKAEVQRLADALFYFLFPMLSEDPKPARVQYALLRHDLMRLLYPLTKDGGESVANIANGFFDQMPQVYEMLLEDAQAFYEFDPAATCTEEVIATYPGFYAIANYRISNLLHRLGTPLLPRFFSEYVHSKTGIDIHPGAAIGRSFFIDHGTGVVIGATTTIGNKVKIYQGVTLGALQVDKSLANVKRHPTIEDNCVLYANSTILGGKTVVGHDSVIGGNSWLTESVPPYSVVLHQSQVKVRTRPFDEPVNFVI
ncbi:MAG TPA: serine acetyltransferase [Saprospirales bacterium]|nr:serine acetyltransferase [Saprospirales bacterium]